MVAALLGRTDLLVFFFLFRDVCGRMIGVLFVGADAWGGSNNLRKLLTNSCSKTFLLLRMFLKKTKVCVIDAQRRPSVPATILPSVRPFAQAEDELQNSASRSCKI